MKRDVVALKAKGLPAYGMWRASIPNLTGMLTADTVF